MNGIVKRCKFTVALLLVALAVQVYAQKAPQREIAITIDDLPAAGGRFHDRDRNH